MTYQEWCDFTRSVILQQLKDFPALMHKSKIICHPLPPDADLIDALRFVRGVFVSAGAAEPTEITVPLWPSPEEIEDIRLRLPHRTTRGDTQ